MMTSAADVCSADDVIPTYTPSPLTIPAKIPSDTPHIKLPDIQSNLSGTCTDGKELNYTLKTFDINHSDVLLHNRVWQQGYPNVYGARIPVPSDWNIDELERMLTGYNDREVTQFLRFGWPSNRLPQAPDPCISNANYASANSFPEYVETYINKEIKAGATFGPFQKIPFNGRVGVSPLSTRIKKDGVSRRTILDLSSPEGQSVNDFIDKDSFLGFSVKLCFPGVDDLAKRIYELGRHCRLWKKDLRRWFRQIPLDPGDYDLFGFMWGGLYYFDKVLVMGHRTSPYIAQRITDALAYIHRIKGYFLLNYIDDFMGAEAARMAEASYAQMGEMLESVGVSEALDKDVPPCEECEFLGVGFNTRELTMHVTADRVHEILDLVKTWLHKATFTRNELEELIGKLQFVANCVRPGRIFITRLLNALRSTCRHLTYAVDPDMKRDLLWWQTFLPTYNGVSIMWMHQELEADSIISTDASQTGVGAVMWGVGYLRGRVPDQWSQLNIAYLELWAVIFALRAWGEKLKGRKIVLKCDNMAVVEVLNNGRSRDWFLQAGLREFTFICATGQFEVRLQYVRSKFNTVADWLSRWFKGQGERRLLRDHERGCRLPHKRISPGSFKFDNSW